MFKQGTDSTSTAGPAPIRVGSSFSRPAALFGGAAALIAITAIATTLVVKPAAPVGNAGSEGSLASVAAQPQMSPTKTTAGDTPSGSKPAPVQAQRKAGGSVSAPREKSPTSERVAAAACATCGVVESVTPVQKKGDGTGLGAVGGAVLGGVIGHQIGGGSGRDAMTAVGAVGGGIAGHEVEKRARATTIYQISVRMEDGSHRTITQSTAPTVGQKVTLEGNKLAARG